MKCEFCGKDEALPFVCNYCGGVFCADHRLPEAHQCKGDLAQKRVIIAPPETTYTWSSSTYTPQPQPQVSPENVFSRIEVRDVAIAYLGLGLAFFIASTGITNLLTLSPGGFFQVIPGHPVPLSPAEMLAISLIAVGPGFVLHEMSHKFAARRYRYWAEFRMWPIGLVLALVTSIIGVIFAAPGATYISGQGITVEQNGKISVAGPLTNVVVALVFSPFFVFGSGFWGWLGYFGVFINTWLALFNMLPIMPLDGAKVFAWSKPGWVSVFAPLAVVIALFWLGVL
jgi:Zn-dependent protease